MTGVEKKKEKMENLILFQTVRNSYGEVGSEWQRKLKNRENLIHTDEFTFHEIKIFLMKNSFSK